MSSPRERELESEIQRLRRQLAELREAADAAMAELHGTQAELVGAAKLATLGTLVAGIAHEINTPLGALNSNHHVLMRALEKLGVILQDERVEPDELDELRRIVRAINGIMKVNHMAVDRMVALVGSLRSFGRPDRAETDRVDLHEGIDSTLAILQHQLKHRVEVVRHYGELPLVECYPQQINQVLMNLLLNAAQAIRERGTITIRTASDGDRVRIAITDTGVGIAPENHARIFEPGFTTKGSRIGMGLGLLICRQVVERHGGRLELQSQLGQGATFTLTLPTELPADPAAAPLPLAGTASKGA